MARRCWLRASIVGAALAGAAGAASCTSAETSSSFTAPSSTKCQFHISASPSTFPASGGEGTLGIDTTRDCAWSVEASASWVSLSTTAGQGGASVSYSVAGNSVPSARAATLAVEGERLQLSQSAAPCRYSLSRDEDRIGYEGGGLSVGVETLDGCRWTAASDAGWLSIASGATGTRSATVALLAEENHGAERVARLTVGGAVEEVTQDAAPAAPPSPAPAPPPSPAPPPPPEEHPTHLEGTIDQLSGRCPDVSLTVGGTSVLANESTEYRHGSCRRLDEGDEVAVDGTAQPDGSVLADLIRMLHDDDAH